MIVIAARVVDGKIEIQTDLQEGTSLAILAAGESHFQLTHDEEEELVTALSDNRSGKFEDGRDVLRDLKGVSSR